MKGFNYFLYVVVLSLFVGIFIASNMSKSIYEKNNVDKAISLCNSDLPRKIGTIGTLDSIVCHGGTIIYNITVFGDNRIKDIYRKNYDKFKDILKYSIASMNGQRNMGNLFSSILDTNGLNLGVRIYTQDGDVTEWSMPGSELSDFMEACHLSPTTALGNIIDMHVEIANIHLPVKIEDIRDPIKSVVLNSFLGELDESCLPISISHVGEDIIFKYNVAEDSIDLDELDKIKGNSNALELFASSLVEDEDVQEFLGIIAISHSNIIITYEGRNTNKIVSIRIPYSILKKYCKVPEYLLS